MIASAMIFLVLLIPDTEKPVMALMMSFPTMTECRLLLDKVPKEDKGKYQCLRIDINPDPEGTSI